MDASALRLVGEPPFPQGEFERLNTIVSGSGMLVARSSVGLSLPKETHSHGSYEFMCPLTRMPHTLVGGRVHSVGPGQVVPISHNVEHGASEAMTNVRLVAINVGRGCLEEVVQVICGRRNVVFHNGPARLQLNLWHLLQDFVEEGVARQPGYRFVLDTLTSLIVVALLRQLDSDLPRIDVTPCHREPKNIRRAMDFLQASYDREFSLDDVAAVANLSPFHFIRVFRGHTGKTPYEYFLDVKIERACALLRTSNLTITEVCYLCGFNSPSHFATVFKKRMGLSPTSYRNVVTS